MQGRILDKSQHTDYISLDKLIPKKHYLRKVNECIDFSFIEEITESCYCPNNGRPSVAPELYFRMMLIGYIFSIKSTRQLVQDIHYNICYRWFCGLTLNDSIPHHASLSRIKKSYTIEVFEKFFQSIVEQCQQAGLLQSQSVMTDSTLIQANASLNSMKPLNKEVPKNIKPSKDGISENKWHISNKTYRSKTDPDATLAFKSGTLRSLKYKAHVCCDSKSRVISAIKITTGAVHDSQAYLDLIVQLKNKLMLREVIADRAYGSGEVISSLNDMGIQEFIPLFTTRSGKTPDKEIHGINYDEIKKTYICFANIEFKPGKINSEGYISYRTHTKDCRECSLKAICQVPQMKNRDIRVMARHIHADLFQKVKIKMETEEFKEKFRERLWKIEGVMNELKNYHCLSKAKYRGLDNMQIQAYIDAVVINIKRLVNFLLFSVISHCMIKNSASFTTGRYLIFHKQGIIGKEQKRNSMNLLDRQNSKNQEFVIDKIFHPLDVHFDTNFLSAWLSYYYSVHVKGSPEKTGKAYKATTINRTMATIRHEGRWLHQQRPLLAGDLLAQVKDVQTDAPDWHGLTSRQLMRLKSACEQRIKSCTRKNQNPIMETALFYVLLGTGLRESEVVTLKIGQYRQKGLYDVLRHKSKRVSQKIPLPQESREYLDQYLTLRKGLDDEPLFITRYGTALKTLDIYRICQRVLKQALTYLPESEQFSFTPHQLRHTFLKKVTDKHGVHFAQELSGNVSIKEIFRYAKPSQEEMQETIEELFA